MARIRTYEAPERRIQPTDRGFHALTQAAARTQQLAVRIGANTTEGFRELGHNLDEAQNRRQRDQDRAERQARQQAADARREAAEAKADAREQARQFKTADQVKGHMEINGAQGREAHAQMTADLAKQWDAIRDTPAYLKDPAGAQAKFNREVRDPAQAAWREKFSSEYGSAWADKQLSSDNAHYAKQNSTDMAHDMGHAAILSAHGQAQALIDHVRAHPEDYDKSLSDWRHGQEGARGTTPGNMGGAFSSNPAEITDDNLRVFRTLEGNADGHADHAVSPAGAVGRNQILPSTAQQYGFDPGQLQNPAYNDNVARKIIADLSKRYNGDPKAMFIAYNAGPGRADAWLASGKDDSTLPGETRNYVASAENHGYVGPGGSVGPNLSDRQKLQKTDAKVENELAKARIMGIADNGDPARARAEMNTEGKYPGLSDQDRKTTLDHINGAEVKQQRSQEYSAANVEKNAKQASEARSLQYLNRIRENGDKPDGQILDDITKDPMLRRDEQKALVDASHRLHGAGYSIESNPDDVRAAAASMANPKGKMDAIDIINAVAQPPGYTLKNPDGTDKVGPDGQPQKGAAISPWDAEMLLGHLDPNNAGSEMQMSYLAHNLDDLHTKLAPRNPDGSPNTAGERAYDVAAREYTARYRQGLANGLTPEQMSSKDDKEYLLGKGDSWVQQFAPGHVQALDAARANAAGAVDDKPGVEVEDVSKGGAYAMPEDRTPENTTPREPREPREPLAPPPDVPEPTEAPAAENE